MPSFATRRRQRRQRRQRRRWRPPCRHKSDAAVAASVKGAVISDQVKGQRFSPPADLFIDQSDVVVVASAVGARGVGGVGGVAQSRDGGAAEFRRLRTQSARRRHVLRPRIR